VHPYLLCKHKLLFWMRLITVNRLTALVTVHLNETNTNKNDKNTQQNY